MRLSNEIHVALLLNIPIIDQVLPKLAITSSDFFRLVSNVGYCRRLKPICEYCAPWPVKMKAALTSSLGIRISGENERGLTRSLEGNVCSTSFLLTNANVRHGISDR